MAYAFFARRAAAFLMISTLVVSCTADGLVPPAAIDRGTRVSAIAPQPIEAAPSYPVEPQPLPPQSSQAAKPMIDSDEALALTQPQMQAPAYHAPRVMGAPASNLGTLTYSANGVNIDSELGLGEAAAPRVVGLAEEQNADIAEGVSNQPVVDGIGTDNPRPVGRRPAYPVAQPMSAPVSAPVAQTPDVITIPPKRSGQNQRSDLGQQPRWADQSLVTPPSTPQTQEVAMLMPKKPSTDAPPLSPRFDEPMPASELACRRELKRMGVIFTDKPRIYDGPSCGIDYPVSLTGLSGNISVSPAVTLNCETTLAFAKWVKNELAPSARARYLTGIGSIQPMGGYSCRRMNNSRQRYNPMSEHARGNAIDIGRFTLKNGHEIDVRKKGFFAFREKGLLKAVRTDSCKYFNTVLGPGSNPEHWNHFHFDLRDRASGNRYCD
ncbi:extensin-like domain-containing protein [Rhizobium sp. SL86]|uniref:extensin-like domain-containing protein n=1 Tax=Rhizobium sp. SL86 TaxID=2995148 RepID=UPI0022729730|nr:extensin family protein [Rhizobium sp. SL86]MCY1668932.1 extensin family protein [Rhizobium sp. SL86]